MDMRMSDPSEPIIEITNSWIIEAYVEEDATVQMPLDAPPPADFGIFLRGSREPWPPSAFTPRPPSRPKWDSLTGSITIVGAPRPARPRTPSAYSVVPREPAFSAMPPEEATRPLAPRVIARPAPRAIACPAPRAIVRPAPKTIVERAERALERVPDVVFRWSMGFVGMAVFGAMLLVLLLPRHRADELQPVTRNDARAAQAPPPAVAHAPRPSLQLGPVLANGETVHANGSSPRPSSK